MSHDTDSLNTQNVVVDGPGELGHNAPPSSAYPEILELRRLYIEAGLIKDVPLPPARPSNEK